jgi:hypothetical protein
LLATGDIGYLEAALDVGIASLRAGHQAEKETRSTRG